MWRLYVLADFLYEVGLLEAGLAMLDGSYWRESIYDQRNFESPSAPNASVGGGD